MQTPKVLVRLKRRRGYKQWIVQKCPYCGEKHIHGAGEGKDDPMKFLSHRVAHCGDPYIRKEGFNNDAGYILELDVMVICKNIVLDECCGNHVDPEDCYHMTPHYKSECENLISNCPTFMGPDPAWRARNLKQCRPTTQPLTL
jgi:hypothetical protein